jgi:hypothetical protein
MLNSYLKKINLIEFFKKNLSFCTVFIIGLFFINSLLLSRNIYDPHHVNLIFVEASNFLHGKYLYKDIFVKYGVLATVTNAFGLFLFGDNIFSIFLITNIFYFSSVLLLFFIFSYLKISKYNNFCLILIILNIHSYIYLPWSTYLAFFPILLSLIFIIRIKKNYLLSGIFLALSCLFRESYFLSVLFIFFFMLFVFFFNKEKKINFILYIIGFLIPLTIFICYLILTKNYVIWTELIIPSYKLDLDAQLGLEGKHFNSISNTYIKYFLHVISKILLNIRDHFAHSYFLFYLIFISCFYIIFYEVFRIKKITIKSVIAFYSLSCSIQSFYVLEAWRLICGSIVGIIIFNDYVYTLFKKKFISLVYSIFLASFVILNWSFYFVSLENYFRFFKKEPYENFKKLEQFNNMNYGKDIHGKYNKFSKLCDSLRTNINLKYSINYTSDASLSYFCKTVPRNYYPWDNDLYTKTFLKSSTISKYSDANNSNTIIFLAINNNQNLLSNYKILHIVNWNFNFNQTYDKLAIVKKK